MHTNFAITVLKNAMNLKTFGTYGGHPHIINNKQCLFKSKEASNKKIRWVHIWQKKVNNTSPNILLDFCNTIENAACRKREFTNRPRSYKPDPI